MFLGFILLCLLNGTDATADDGLQINPIGFAQFWDVYDRKNTTVSSHNQLKIYRARLGLTGKISPKMQFFTMLEAGDSSPSGTAGSAALVDAHATYIFSPHFKLRVGQDWYRFSREGTYTAFEMPFIQRSEAVDNVWLNMGRKGKGSYDRGLYAFGDVNAGEIPLSYVFSVTDGSGLNTADENKNKDFTLRLTTIPLLGLSLGASAFSGHSTVNQQTMEESALGFDLYYQWKNKLRFWGEWIRGSYNASANGQVPRVIPTGFYLAAGFSPMKNWEVLARQSYASANKDLGHKITTSTLGLTYALRDLTNLKLNYLIRKASNDYAPYTGLNYRPGNMILLQLQLFFFPEKMKKNFLAPLGMEPEPTE